MAERGLKKQYQEILADNFPTSIEMKFGKESYQQSLKFEKVTWRSGDKQQGLRYGENPHQAAALYRLTNGNLVLGDVRSVGPGKGLASTAKLVKSGKHPSLINITDVDSALNILRYLNHIPAAVIVKHNNPCGVAQRESLAQSYQDAFMADPIAAFGGAVALNREVDRECAEEISRHYTEVVAAPAYSSKALEVFEKKKNIRLMEIHNMDRLQDFAVLPHVDFHSLLDGGLVLQWSYRTRIRTAEDFLSAETQYQGRDYRVARQASDSELSDLLFGWFVEAGVTSNSVLYIKDRTTIGIGTGEQDRVGCAQIARDKAYQKCRQRRALLTYKRGYTDLDHERRNEIDQYVQVQHGDIRGSVMISDGFFPFRDGIEVGLREGVRAVAQPGGSLRDFESIEACNEYDAAMVFTGERAFRH